MSDGPEIFIFFRPCYCSGGDKQKHIQTPTARTEISGSNQYRFHPVLPNLDDQALNTGQIGCQELGACLKSSKAIWLQLSLFKPIENPPAPINRFYKMVSHTLSDGQKPRKCENLLKY